MKRVKQSIDQYRNINGKFYIFDTANLEKMPFVKRECRKAGFSYRMIDGQLFTEVQDGKYYTGASHE